MRRGNRRRGLPIARVIVAAGAAVALLAAGWVGSSLFVSPAQREAAATPPDPSPIAAEVERGPLADTVTFSAQAGRMDRDTVVVTSSSGDMAVVTGVPVDEGDTAETGDAIVEVNGRPVIVLPGRFAFYRDLHENDEGPDVKQLQNALGDQTKGLPVTGVVDAATISAVTALYAAAGYDDPDDVILRAAETAVVRTPATILSTVAIGSPADGSLSISLEAGDPVGRAAVPPAVGGQLTADMRGLVLGTDVEVAIISVTVAEDPTADATVLLSTSKPVEAGEYTVQFETSRVVDDGLIVPSTAVAESGDLTYVVRSRSDQDDVQIEVNVLGSLNGRTAVEPVRAGDLIETDKVLID